MNDTLEYFTETAYSIEKSYKNLFKDKNYIDKNRTFRFCKDTSIVITLIGGVENDHLKNASKKFGKEMLENHVLTYDTSTEIDGRNAYVLKISPNKNADKTTISGLLYIDMQTFAFLKIDLKYIQKNADKYSVLQQSYSANYRFVGDKCYPASFSSSSEKYFKKNGRDFKANAFLLNVVTSVDTAIDKQNTNKTLFQGGNSLEYYATDYDTTFWDKFAAILPDKATEQALTSYQKNKKESGDLVSLKSEPVKSKNIKIIPELYHPCISFFLSTQTPNNLFTFNETYMSLNGLVNYYLAKDKTTFKVSSYITTLYTMLLSIPFQSVEAEREVLANNKIFASYNPTLFNPNVTSYCNGVDDFELSDLKSTNYSDFIRLHTIRKDANYLSIKSMEEKIALSDLNNKKVRNDYFKTHYVELFIRRFAYSIYYLPTYDFVSMSSNKSERKEPIIMDKPKSFVKYLFNPTDSFHRYTSKDDLNEEELRYLKKMARFSFLNLLSPQAVGVKPFKLCKDTRFTFSVSYLLVPFGEMFEQNFWIYSKINTVGLSLRQYKNYKSYGAGLGLKFYNHKITEKLNCQTSVDYWYQPETLTFYDNHFVNGFGVNQTFEYKMREDPYNHNGDLSLYLGYDLKTKGYQPQNLSVNEDFSVFCGIKYNFNNY